MTVKEIADQLSDIEDDDDSIMSGFSDDSLFDHDWAPEKKAKYASSSDSEVIDDVAPMETDTPQMDAGNNSDCSLPPPEQAAGPCEQEFRVYMCPPVERPDAQTDSDDG